MKRSFGSDNHSGIHPSILDAIARANAGDERSYGEDPYTEKAVDKFKEMFGENIDVYFVGNGTSANVLSLQVMLQPYHAIICAETAHIQVDECGAPERFTGCKLLTCPTPDGKLRPEILPPHLTEVGFEHHVQPKVVSISQVSELGTVYSIEEIRDLADFAHAHGMFLHMDGARFANATVSLGCDPRAMTIGAGVDVMTFGGTKNGMMLGEAIIFFNPEMSKEFKYIRKQGMQLLSKMRFVSAQFLAYLEDNLWLNNAENANKMAKILEKGLLELKDCHIHYPVQANAIFLSLPRETAFKLQEEFFFYFWDQDPLEIRLMTSFMTTEQDIESFLSSLKRIMEHR
ncbi:MAG TPA: low specificity L-threonine aldolase [Candidatus Cloacimonadota bacterium]|nr:low specificity L-threonine aldolase [Candidatus Cloacimonadota bacterium]HPT71275.1 low specificity L-threonine aldolase [Candidatus Cloacimonadota bacterium]